MIQLTNKTSVALLISLMKKNYGISWWALGDRKDFIVVGMHLPTGEVGYYIPDEYIDYFTGMIQLPKADLLDKSFENDAADRLLEWAVSL